MDYSLIDSILDDFQKVFKDVKEKHDLSNATIERWRWDLPQIYLICKGYDAIWRNINFLLHADRSNHDNLAGQLEVNAWQDVQKDNRWMRRWRHQLIAEGNISEMFVLWRGYETVSKWRVEDLTTQQSLSKEASDLLDQQRS